MNILLHIGIRKTGTSLIQNFCQLNQAQLLRLGYYYPDNDKIHERYGKTAGHWNLHKIIEGRESRYSLRDYLPQPHPAENIILSNEAITSEHCEFMDIARKFKLMLSDDMQVKIIVYLRRQDLYINSLYNEGIISGNKKSTWSIKGFLESNYAPELDYYKLINTWRISFGAENIIVRPFEKQQLFESDLIKDFLNCIGIKWQEEFIVPGEECKNSSPDLNLVETIRQINRIPLKNTKLYKEFLEKVFEELVYNGPYKSKPGQSFLSPAERINMLDEYRDRNEMVAREFLDRTDGKLFYEPEPKFNTQWRKPSISDPDLFIKVFTLLLELIEFEKQNFISNNEKSINELKKRMDNALEAIKKNDEILMELMSFKKNTLEAIQDHDINLKQLTLFKSNISNDLKGFRSNAWDYIKKLEKNMIEKNDQIDKIKSENMVLKRWLRSNILTSYLHSRKNIWKKLFRFIIYRGKSEIKMLIKAGLVDAAYYFDKYPDTIKGGMSATEHYVRYGAQEGRNPLDDFNTVQYLVEHPEVVYTGVNPLIHRYLRR